jgi:hypothetical protein
MQKINTYIPNKLKLITLYSSKMDSRTSGVEAPSGLQSPTNRASRSLFSQETLELTPGSQSSHGTVNTNVYDTPTDPDRIALESVGGTPVVFSWYAVRKSIYGRRIICESWEDCELHVKVWNYSRTEALIPSCVEFAKFDHIEDAVRFVYS